MRLPEVPTDRLVRWVRSPGMERLFDWFKITEEAGDRGAAEVLIAAMEGETRGFHRLATLVEAAFRIPADGRRKFARAALETDALWGERQWWADREYSPDTLRGSRSFTILVVGLLGRDPGPLDTPERRGAIARALRRP